jgi:hypothetical protein
MLVKIEQEAKILLEDRFFEISDHYTAFSAAVGLAILAVTTHQLESTRQS